jgi:hypothetical protein
VWARAFGLFVIAGKTVLRKNLVWCDAVRLAGLELLS